MRQSTQDYRRLSLALGLWLLVHLAACADTPSPTPFEIFLEARNSLAGRRNGVLLEASAKVEGDELKIRWSLDYNGPRQPLIIITPTIELGTAGQTNVFFFAKGADSKPCQAHLASGVAGKYGSDNLWFLIVPKGQRATGLIPLPVAKVEQQMRKVWPSQLALPRSLFVQLNQKPWERAQQHKLDAWTGDLHSKVLDLKLKTE